MSNLVFDLLAIDVGEKSTIQDDANLLHSLMSNGTLWASPELKQGPSRIVDGALELSVKTVVSDPAAESALNKAFQIHAVGPMEKLEPLRQLVALHLGTQSFEKLYILTDEVSEQLSCKIYPQINRVENRLRGYIVRFMATRLGPRWWDITATSELKKKAYDRQSNESVFFPLVDHNAYAVDFGDLGGLIYSHISGANSKEKILADIQKVEESPEAIRQLKLRLQGNYQRFFDANFRAKGFQQKWENLNKLRRKVAHNSLFVAKDLKDATQLCDELAEIIDDATKEVDALTLAEDETESIKETLVEHGFFNVADEDTFLFELEKAESYFARRPDGFVGLRHFVTTHLGNLGYDFKASYDLISELEAAGKIVVYQVPNPNDPAQPTSAIRCSRSIETEQDDARERPVAREMESTSTAASP